MAKECPKCQQEMYKSYEPKVVVLSSVNGKIPTKVQCWRCSGCRYIEKGGE